MGFSFCPKRFCAVIADAPAVIRNARRFVSISILFSDSEQLTDISAVRSERLSIARPGAASLFHDEPAGPVCFLYLGGQILTFEIALSQRHLSGDFFSAECLPMNCLGSFEICCLKIG